MSGTVEENSSGQLHKKKNQGKNQGNFEKNINFLLNFRKCKLKEIKKLNSYIAIYMWKSTMPPIRDIAP